MPVRAVVSKPTGARKVFLWLYSFMVVNSVHIVVAIRRDFFFPLRNHQWRRIAEAQHFWIVTLMRRCRKCSLVLPSANQPGTGAENLEGEWTLTLLWTWKPEVALEISRLRLRKAEKGVAHRWNNGKPNASGTGWEMHQDRLRNALASARCFGEEVPKW